MRAHYAGGFWFAVSSCSTVLALRTEFADIITVLAWRLRSWRAVCAAPLPDQPQISFSFPDPFLSIPTSHLHPPTAHRALSRTTLRDYIGILVSSRVTLSRLSTCLVAEPRCTSPALDTVPELGTLPTNSSGMSPNASSLSEPRSYRPRCPFSTGRAPARNPSSAVRPVRSKAAFP
jgi:hypothetical protein